jgi:hypothetical protein
MMQLGIRFDAAVSRRSMIFLNICVRNYALFRSDP